MENQNEYIKFIKSRLKDNGFTIKNNLCFKIENQILFVLFFHKRADGIYNTELGLSLDINTVPSIKNMDVLDSPAINLNIKKEDLDVDYNNGMLNFILNWFKERNSVENIEKLYKEKQLGYFVSHLKEVYRKNLQVNKK